MMDCHHRSDIKKAGDSLLRLFLMVQYDFTSEIYLFFSKSRISPSSFSSADGSGSGAGSSSFLAVNLFIPLIIRKIQGGAFSEVDTTVKHTDDRHQHVVNQ